MLDHFDLLIRTRTEQVYGARRVTFKLTEAALDLCPLIDDYAKEWAATEGFEIVFTPSGAAITCSRERADDLADHFEYVANRQETSTTFGEARAASAARARILKAREG